MANKTELASVDEVLNKTKPEPVDTGVKHNATAIQEQKYNAAMNKRKALVKQYREEEKVNVTVSPFYAPYLGRVIRQSVNGIVVDVPADGNTYKINKTHAGHILAKIKRIDIMRARQKRQADVQKNVEHTPGELHL